MYIQVHEHFESTCNAELRTLKHLRSEKMVGRVGIEPTTSLLICTEY